MFQEAIKEWSAQTCIDFVLVDDQLESDNHIIFIKSEELGWVIKLQLMLHTIHFSMVVYLQGSTVMQGLIRRGWLPEILPCIDFLL